MTSLPLAGRIAVVTGAGGGIGSAIVRRFVADGATVGALDRDAAALARLVDATGAAVSPIVADLRDPDTTATALDTFVRDAGRVTILVNNAGVGGTGAFLDVDDAAWSEMLAVHVGGTVACTRALLPGMLEAGDGRIVTILSDGVWHGRTTVPYTTAKGALLGFTRSLATEVAARGVLVNAVAPGPVATPMLLDGSSDDLAAELATVPIGRFLVPDEVAATVAFLCGPGGVVYVGQVLGPNGGTVLAG